MVTLKMDEAMIKVPDSAKIDIDETALHAYLANKLAEALETDVSISIDYCLNHITLTNKNDTTREISVDIDDDTCRLLRYITMIIVKYKAFVA